MREIQFEWDEWNISHIAQHDVEPSEVEEVFEHFHIIRKTRQGRRIAYGQTLDGRHLFLFSSLNRNYDENLESYSFIEIRESILSQHVA